VNCTEPSPSVRVPWFKSRNSLAALSSEACNDVAGRERRRERGERGKRREWEREGEEG